MSICLREMDKRVQHVDDKQSAEAQNTPQPGKGDALEHKHSWNTVFYLFLCTNCRGLIAFCLNFLQTFFSFFGVDWLGANLEGENVRGGCTPPLGDAGGCH